MAQIYFAFIHRSERFSAFQILFQLHFESFHCLPIELQQQNNSRQRWNEHTTTIYILQAQNGNVKFKKTNNNDELLLFILFSPFLVLMFLWWLRNNFLWFLHLFFPFCLMFTCTLSTWLTLYETHTRHLSSSGEIAKQQTFNCLAHVQLYHIEVKLYTRISSTWQTFHRKLVCIREWCRVEHLDKQNVGKNARLITF